MVFVDSWSYRTKNKTSETTQSSETMDLTLEPMDTMIVTKLGEKLL